VAKQNFIHRHGHGLIESVRSRTKLSQENAELAAVSSCLSSLPPVDDTELTYFFDWIENSNDIFETS
jgi:hypothetical protein